jgi:membrane-bound lytic murein transglycosylase
VPTGDFASPLYRRPPNLVAAGRRKLGDAFPSKGVFVGRRLGRRKIVPYYTRAEIEDGALDGWHLEICYLHDPVDVLFAQIQGSARIRLEDGTILRVNYDSHNGWPYTPVGRVLADMKALTKDQVSMQSIRDWMEANPDQAKDVRRANKSYVFFRITVKNSGDFFMLLPRALDPVKAGRDIPLPPERPSLFSFATGTMEDPTVPDSAAAQDVPLPEPKPDAVPTVSAAPAPKVKATMRQKK